MFKWYYKFKEHCVKGAYLKAIENAKELREIEYKRVKSLLSDSEPIPPVLLGRMEANDRLVLRLTKRLNERFPVKKEPKYHKKLK